MGHLNFDVPIFRERSASADSGKRVNPRILANASACVTKLRAPGGCDFHIVVALQECIAAGVTYESLGTTYQEIKDARTEICQTHARQWLRQIREERKHNRKVSEMITLMKKWLVTGELSYSQIKATDEEAEFFGEISPQDKAS